jgi:hypothetical protein
MLPFMAIVISKSPLVSKAVKRPKLRKFAPRSASAVDRYIGARIREQRLELNMSQVQLGGLERLAVIHVRARPDKINRSGRLRSSARVTRRLRLA